MIQASIDSGDKASTENKGLRVAKELPARTVTPLIFYLIYAEFQGQMFRSIIQIA